MLIRSQQLRTKKYRS